MTTRFLLLTLLVGPSVSAAAGPWPFGSIHRVPLGDQVVAEQRFWTALTRQPVYDNLCHGRRDTGKKQWVWRAAGTKFYLYDRAGRRLTNHGYDAVAVTGQRLIYGVIEAKKGPATVEVVSPTGMITPVLDFDSGDYHSATPTSLCTIGIG